MNPGRIRSGADPPGWRLSRGRSAPLLLAAATLLLPALLKGRQVLSQAEKPPQVPLRSLGKAPVQASLAGGESHRYSLDLPPRRFVELALREKGINLRLRVLRADGDPEIEMDTAGSTLATERVRLLSGSGQNFIVEVQARLARAPQGDYILQVETERQAEPGDERRMRASRAEAEGHRFYLLGGKANRLQAIDSYRQALQALQELGALQPEAQLLYWIGLTRRLLGEYQGALRDLQKARKLFQSSGDKAGEALALVQTGRTHRALSDDGQAEEFYRTALELARQSGAPVPQALALSNLAVMHRYGGNLPASLELQLQAVALFQKAQQISHLSGALSQLAQFEQLTGRSIEALNHFQAASELSDPDSITHAYLLNNLGLLLSRMGEKQQALDSYSQGLPLARRLGLRNLERILLANLGSLYMDLEQFSAARQHFTQALSLLDAQAKPEQRAAVLNNLGRLHAAQQEAQAAGNYYQEALRLYRQSGIPDREATVLSNLGALLKDQGRLSEALQHLEQALKLREQLQDVIGQSRTRRHMAQAYEGLGDAENALRQFEMALQLSRQVSYPTGELLCLNETARLYMDQGNLAAATPLLEEALKLAESQRLELFGDYLRSAYFASLREAYQLNVELLMRLHQRAPEQGHDIQAWQVAEASRARSLNDTLRRSQQDFEAGADAGLLKQRRNLRRRINELAARRDQQLADGKGIQAVSGLEAQISSLVSEYRQVDSRIQASSGALEGSQPAQISEIQALLGGDSLILQFFVAPRKSYFWALSSQAVQSFSLPGEDEIESLASQAHSLLSRSSFQTDPGSAGQLRARLSKMLVEPVGHVLKKRRLVVIADGALHFLPFAWLLSNSPGSAQGALLSDHEIVYLPSASILAELRGRAKKRSTGPYQVAVAADPVFRSSDARLHLVASAMPEDAAELPLNLQRNSLERLTWSRREAESIQDQVGKDKVYLALGFDANLEAIREDAFARSRIVHFATHGQVDSLNPELSALVLSLFDQQGRPREGFLRLHDIYGLRLQADLVVLSACQTALGKQIRGEGLLGLTRGFLAAGSSGVLATLWRVDDRATSELFRRFYRSLIQDGLPPAAALRHAQLALRQQPRWRDPFYWAAFVLQGDWRSNR